MFTQTIIASTTHIDRHRERMSVEALEGMASKVNREYIPYLIEHDFNRQIGVLLSAKVEKMDDEYALLVVTGIFETEEEFDLYPNGAKNEVWREYMEYLNFVPESGVRTEEVETPQTLEQKLETYLDSTKVLPDGTIYRIKHFVTSVNDLEVHVWPKDHDPAHFHVISKQRNFDARFDLNTLEFLSNKSGRAKKKDVKKIQSFFKNRPDAWADLKNRHQKMQG